MKGKILLATGIAIGYVLGTRAGREKYDQMVAGFHRFWNDPRVQQQVHNAEDFVKDKAPEVAGFVADQTKNVAAKVTGSTSKPAASKPAARKPAARKPASAD